MLDDIDDISFSKRRYFLIVSWMSISVYCIPTRDTHITRDMCMGDTHITGIHISLWHLYRIRHPSELTERDWEKARGKWTAGNGRTIIRQDGIRVNSSTSVNMERKSDTRKDRITVFKGKFNCQFLKVGRIFQWGQLDGTIHLGNIRSYSMTELSHPKNRQCAGVQASWIQRVNVTKWKICEG